LQPLDLGLGISPNGSEDVSVALAFGVSFSRQPPDLGLYAV